MTPRRRGPAAGPVGEGVMDGQAFTRRRGSGDYPAKSS